MSPRSTELMARAREMLAAARHEASGGFDARATSSAYYAMLFAARAALSEEDLHARTHADVWTLFSQTFVLTDRFDAKLASAARDAQQRREASDYGVEPATPDEARAAIELAERFVAAVDERFA